MSFYDKVRGQKFLSFTLMLFTLAVGILIGTIAQTGAKAAKEQVAAPDATPLVIPKTAVIENEFTKVAKNLEPSVVNIETEYIPKTNTQTRNANPNARRRQQQQHRQRQLHRHGEREIVPDGMCVPLAEDIGAMAAEVMLELVNEPNSRVGKDPDVLGQIEHDVFE